MFCTLRSTNNVNKSQTSIKSNTVNTINTLRNDNIPDDTCNDTNKYPNANTYDNPRIKKGFQHRQECNKLMAPITKQEIVQNIKDCDNNKNHGL